MESGPLYRNHTDKGSAFVRVVCDLTVALSGFALGAVLGIGTVVTAFGMGPMISFFNVHMSEPLRYGKAGKP